MERPDEELVLHFYGEHPAPGELERALATDPELARRYEALRASLGALGSLEAPEPRAGLEGRMWARVAPELTRSTSRRTKFPGWLGWGALAASLLTVAVLAFVAGRASRPLPVADEGEVAAKLEALTPAARDRVLAVALAEHLDSSERLMIEISNGVPTDEEERRWAGALLSANRLYHRAAERAGQRRIAALLAELESLLAQLANDPSAGAGSELRFAQERIEQRDLLFKVRVTRSRLKELS